MFIVNATDNPPAVAASTFNIGPHRTTNSALPAVLQLISALQSTWHVHIAIIAAVNATLYHT
jgi:hypothetical protein